MSLKNKTTKILNLIFRKNYIPRKFVCIRTVFFNIIPRLMSPYLLGYLFIMALVKLYGPNCQLLVNILMSTTSLIGYEIPEKL